MFYVVEVVSILLSYLILCLWGFPVLVIAEPRQLKNYRFIMLPIMGLGMAIIVLYYLFCLEIPVGKAALPCTICIVLVDILLDNM